MTDSLENQENDFVVEEIDLILVKKPNHIQKSYLIQYPSKTRKSEDDLIIGESRFKKQIDLIQQSLKFDTEKSYFCEEKAQILTQNRLKNTMTKSLSNNSRFDSIAFESSKPKYSNNVCLTKLVENQGKLEKQLLIMPIDVLLQMNGKFDEFLNNSSQKNSSINIDDNSNNENQQKLTKVSIKAAKMNSFQNNNNNNSNSNNDNNNNNNDRFKPKMNYQRYMKDQRTLLWSDIIYFDQNCDISQNYRNHLFNFYYRIKDVKMLSNNNINVGNNTDNNNKNLDLDLQKILMNDNIDMEIQRKASNYSPDMINMPILNQLEAFMIKTICSQFTHVIDQFGKKYQHDIILQHLKMFCTIINGVWVIESEKLYEDYDEKLSDLEISKSKLILSRDFILAKLNSDKFVNRKDLSISIRLSGQIIDFILLPICKNIPTKGWKLKLEPDMLFIKMHNDEILTQNAFWHSRMQKLRNDLEKLKVSERKEEILRLKAKSLPEFLKFEKIIFGSEFENLKNLHLKNLKFDQNFFQQNHLILISQNWQKSFNYKNNNNDNNNNNRSNNNNSQDDDDKEDVYVYYPENYPKELLELWIKSPIIDQNEINEILKSKNSDEKIQLQALLNKYCIKCKNNENLYILRKIEFFEENNLKQNNL